MTAALTANTATTGPGATAVPINAIPTERIKSLGLDVATSPTGAKYRPTGAKFRATGAKFRPTGAKFRPTGAKFRPTGAKFRPTGAKYRPVAETTLDAFSDVLATIPEARTTPISQLPIDLDAHPGGWPVLLVGTPLQGRPTQSVSIGEVMDLLVGTALGARPPAADRPRRRSRDRRVAARRREPRRLHARADAADVAELLAEPDVV